MESERSGAGLEAISSFGGPGPGVRGLGSEVPARARARAEVAGRWRCSAGGGAGRPGARTWVRGSPAPGAHFPPRPGRPPDPRPSPLLCRRGRAAPRGSAGRADLGARRSRCVCDAERARRPWSDPEGLSRGQTSKATKHEWL